MMLRRLLILTLLSVVLSAASLFAEQREEGSTMALYQSLSAELDRGVNRNPYIYKGEVMMGVSASHGNIDSSSSQILLLLNSITASGSYTSVMPYIGYTIGDNLVLGAKFGFNRWRGALDSAVIDLGAANDLSFDIPTVGYSSDRFSYGLFLRSYAGLDRKGRIALFADVDLGYTSSRSLFEMDMSSEPIFVRGEGWSVDLNFNPGVEMYIFPNVSASLSFGLGGISYNSREQYDYQGFAVGEAEDSKLSLKFNILAINIGINIHLWSNE